MIAPDSPPTLAAREGNAAFANSLAMLLLRIVLGWIFIYHGGQKCFGWFGGPGIERFAASDAIRTLPILPPAAWAWLAAGSEFAGGVLVLVGLLTRLACLPLIITMLVAIATVTGPKGLDNRSGGYEFNLALIALAGALLLSGPGLISLDALLFRRTLWSRDPQPLSP